MMREGLSQQPQRPRLTKPRCLTRIVSLQAIPSLHFKLQLLAFMSHYLKPPEVPHVGKEPGGSSGDPHPPRGARAPVAVKLHVLCQHPTLAPRKMGPLQRNVQNRSHRLLYSKGPIWHQIPMRLISTTERAACETGYSWSAQALVPKIRSSHMSATVSTTLTCNSSQFGLATALDEYHRQILSRGLMPTPHSLFTRHVVASLPMRIPPMSPSGPALAS